VRKRLMFLPRGGTMMRNRPSADTDSGSEL
jgi:hypothetical protein